MQGVLRLLLMMEVPFLLAAESELITAKKHTMSYQVFWPGALRLIRMEVYECIIDQLSVACRETCCTVDLMLLPLSESAW